MIEAKIYDSLSSRKKREIREQYVRDQNGICPVCDCPLAGEPRADIKALPLDLELFPPNFLGHPVHLQHNHITGLTEAAVHAYCNGVIWQYQGK
jgi:hypothetical protein